MSSTVHRRGNDLRRVGVAAASLLALATLGGCSLFHRPPQIDEPIKLIAVMPIESTEPSSATPPAGVEALPPNAAKEVTAQVYVVLSNSTQWRFVPDLTVAQALTQLKVQGDLATRARALGKAVSADGVLFGTVSKFVDRVGTEFGARQPASVSLSLGLVSVSSGNVLWKGSFDETQTALSSNLFNWWQFWRGGPRWFTADEFARLGIEHLLEDLNSRLEG